VKIGVSSDPLARLATLQTASPSRFELVYAAAIKTGDATQLEAEAHAMLARQRQTDEWFDVAPEMTIGGHKWRHYPIYAFGRFRSEPSQER
jgi:hypothetical protein